eukprot:g67652.t1
MLTRGRYDRYKDKISNEMMKELKHITSQDNITKQNTNEIMTQVTGTIKAVIDRNKRRPKDRHDKPWIHPKLKRMINRQHELWAQSKTNPTPAIIQKHSRYRQIVKKAVEPEKRKYLAEQLELTKDEPKAQAAILRQVVPRKSTDRESPKEIIHNNVSYTNPKNSE